MLQFTLSGARKSKGVPWTVLRLIVTHLHVHVHDLRNAVWLTCRGECGTRRGRLVNAGSFDAPPVRPSVGGAFGGRGQKK
jgi:hypothetical protein